MTIVRRSVSGVAALACVGAIAACGSSSSGSSSSSNSKSTSTGGAAQSSAGANLAAARAAVAAYSKPSAFPVDEPLKDKPTKAFAYFDCSEPTCALLVPIYDAAAKAMGVPAPSVVKAGASASAMQGALSTILAQKPAALLLPAVNLGDLGDSVAQYKSAGIPISAAGIMAGPAQGIAASAGGQANFALLAKMLADWAVAQKGSKANIVWYSTPELDFTVDMTKAFKDQVAQNCPSCQVRYVSIPAAADGSTAPSQIVSDLQSHPDTNLAVFANLETAIGLPAALKVAGIHIPIAGGSPLPQNLQDMKAGAIQAAATFDFGVLAFTEMDAAARLATHQPLTSEEAAGLLQDQLITKANLPSNVSEGYSPDPDYVKQFAKLWSGARSEG